MAANKAKSGRSVDHSILDRSADDAGLDSCHLVEYRKQSNKEICLWVRSRRVVGPKHLGFGCLGHYQDRRNCCLLGDQGRLDLDQSRSIFGGDDSISVAGIKSAVGGCRDRFSAPVAPSGGSRCRRRPRSHWVTGQPKRKLVACSRAPMKKEPNDLFFYLQAPDFRAHTAPHALASRIDNLSC